MSQSHRNYGVTTARERKTQQAEKEDKYVPGPVLRAHNWDGYPKRKGRVFPPGKFRGFVFTNYKVDWDVQEMNIWTNVVFASVGLETCPSTGRQHHQGAVYFKNPRMYSGFDKLLPPNTWFQAARGDEMSNEKYTSKEGNRLLLIGEATSQGTRNDLEDVRRKIIKGGVTPAELARETGVDLDMIKFAETVFRLAGSAPKREWKTSVIWLYGKSGRGKSHIAKALIDAHDENEAWKSSAKLDYWQQYQGQETVWLDEFRQTKCTFAAMLEIMDCTPYEVNVKYGSAQLLAKRLIVTSPMHPEHIFDHAGAEETAQFLRRIEVIWEIDDLYDAAYEGFDFPDIPEFEKFGDVVRECANTRVTAKNPMRFEGKKCLELIAGEWVECARPPKAKAVEPGVADPKCLAPSGCSENSDDGMHNGKHGCPNKLSSDSGTEVGGNIGPSVSVRIATDGAPRLSSLGSPGSHIDSTLEDDLVEYLGDELKEEAKVCPRCDHYVLYYDDGSWECDCFRVNADGTYEGEPYETGDEYEGDDLSVEEDILPPVGYRRQM